MLTSEGDFAAEIRAPSNLLAERGFNAPQVEYKVLDKIACEIEGTQDLHAPIVVVAGRSLLSVVNGDRSRIFPRSAGGDKDDPYGRLMMSIVLALTFSSSRFGSESESSTGVGILRFLERVALLVSRLMIGS
jgi:hypothetical protein